MRLMAMAAAAALLWASPVAAQRSGAPGERRDVDEVITVSGTVTEVARPFATLEAEGETYTVHLGPSWYWRQKGYELAAGDRVTATGQVAPEGDRAHLYLHTLARGEATYVFAGEDGVPLWSRGRSGGGPRAGPRPGAGYGPGAGPGPGARGCCPCCRGECPRGGA
jgi:hypothetical protein